MPTDGLLSSGCRRQVGMVRLGVAGHVIPVDPGNARISHGGGGADNVVVVDNQDDVRDFLASGRARITPRQAALPATCW